MGLVEGALGYLNAEVTEKASALVGESPAKTRRALETAVPAIVTGLAGEAKDPAGARSLLRTIEDLGFAAPEATVSERLGSASGEDLVSMGKGFLSRVFGGRMTGVAEAAAGATGVSHGAMTSLFGLAAPLVLGALGHAAHGRRLDAAGLAGLLGEEQHAAKGALPASVIAALPAGLAARPEVVEARPQVERRVEARPDVERTDRLPPTPHPLARFWPLAFIIPLAIIIPLALHRQPTRTAPARFGAGVTPENAPTVVAPQPGGPIGEQMAQFLSSPEAGPSQRFTFEDLNFEQATANLVPRARATLDDVAAVLRAHPAATVVVEGHTDATGAPADNQRLSVARAEAVKNALVARGVAPDRISTEGYGQDRPIASNDTPDGQARNRRTELVVNR